MLAQLVHLLKTLSYLSPNSRVNLRELARESGTSERLIARDLDFLTRLPIGLEREPDGRYRLSSRGYRVVLALAGECAPRAGFARSEP
ncbi:MAG: hypothetical protein HY720_06815 [Planctomycetes bacterium]|nr:hypothetical protein [Planctomycetota bacterium]